MRPQVQTCQDFLHTPSCCLDPGFSQKVKRMFPGVASLRQSVPLFQALCKWGVGSPLTNMRVERQLASIRRASPAKAPLLERVACAGLLSQTLQAHLGQHPGGDPCAFSLDDVRQFGADAPPLQGLREKNRNPRKARPDLLYANEELAREKRRRLAHVGPGACGEAMTKQTRDGILKAAHAAFKELPEEDPGWGR